MITQDTEARERLRDLERRANKLEVANERLAAVAEHLSDTVEALTKTVQILQSTVDQGRGALWLAMAAAGGLGALLVAMIKRFT